MSRREYKIEIPLQVSDKNGECFTADRWHYANLPFNFSYTQFSIVDAWKTKRYFLQSTLCDYLQVAQKFGTLFVLLTTISNIDQFSSFFSLSESGENL